MLLLLVCLRRVVMVEQGQQLFGAMEVCGERELLLCFTDELKKRNFVICCCWIYGREIVVEDERD
jgi:hypothetical protein